MGRRARVSIPAQGVQFQGGLVALGEVVLDHVSLVHYHPQPLGPQQRPAGPLAVHELRRQGTVRRYHDVVRLQVGGVESLLVAVVDLKLDGDALMEVAVELLYPVTHEAGGADYEGGSPPALPVCRLLGRHDQLEARL